MSIEPVTVAYFERPSEDPVTGEAGILRDEWRVRDLAEIAPEALILAFGEDWRRTRPFAEWLLEHRYIRRGVEEPWKPFDAANTRRQALEYIDGHATAIDPELISVQKARAEYAAAEKQKDEERKRKRREQAERETVKKASEEAFRRLLNSSANRPWGVRWNEFVREHAGDEGMKERVKANMALHDAVTNAVTVPAKVKAIKAFLKEFDR